MSERQRANHEHSASVLVNCGGRSWKRLHRSWGRRTEQTLWLLLDSVQTRLERRRHRAHRCCPTRVDELLLVGPAAATLKPSSIPQDVTRHRRYIALDVVHSFSARGRRRPRCRAQGGGYQAGRGSGCPSRFGTRGPGICLALGHEDHGLSSTTLALCDHVALHPPARQGGLPQRRPRRRHRPIRNARRRKWMS